MAQSTMHNPDAGGRRRFLAAVITAIQGAIGGTLAVILGGSVLSPSFARRRESWLPAGSLSDLPENEPTPVTIRIAREDGYAQIVEREVVFLVRTGDTEVTALSSTCTHLGCRVSWDAEAGNLKCPCHGGVFDRTGKVTDGPPPVPLPRLTTKVDGDRVLVQI
jgi:menaquinol-cytochrome c reductase iron-sulfur subunit